MNPYIELEAAQAELHALYATMPESSDLASLVRLMGVYGEILHELVTRSRDMWEAEAERKRTGLMKVQTATGNPHKVHKFDANDPNVPLAR